MPTLTCGTMNFMMNGKDIKYKLLGKTPEELKEIAVKYQEAIVDNY